MTVRPAPLLALVLAGLLAACGDSTGSKGRQGFVTSQPAQAFGLNGATVTAILSVGDTLPGTSQPWAPKPDGLGAYRDGDALVLLANHELGAGGIRATDGRTVFAGARVSRLVLDPRTVSVLGGSYVLAGSEGYQRLCSATFADADDGFPGGWFLTGEERVEGLQLAISRSGQVVEMPWIGRFAHENLVPIPGVPGRVVLIGLDDNVGGSELYLYVAASEQAVLTGQGRLYVFAAAGAAHSGALAEGGTVTGRFVEVPNAAALSGAALQAEAERLGAFPFVKLEDGDVDRRPGAAPALYFVDSGDATVPGGGAAPWDPFGSIYRLELDPADPTHNARLTLVDRSAGPASGWASPDNVGTSARSLMVQEDPNHSAWARAPRIWRFPLAAGGVGAPQAVAELANPECNGAAGTCWEPSGIIDASAWLGEGAWLFDVMAHTLPVPSLGLSGDGGQLLLLRAPGS